jgi:radical SAM protein with 4Fe4S-binding SPASM domain
MARLVALARSDSHTFTPVPLGDELTLALDKPLPLVPELTCRDVDGRYVWVAVQEAALVVLGEMEHQRMLRLRRGDAPSTLVRTAGEWDALSDLIGRLAAAGFVQGIQGYREHEPAPIAKFARLHLTRACQLECAHCYADSSPHVDRSNELETGRWRDFVSEFAHIGGQQVLFTGGEALIHSGCVELMRLSKALGLHVTLFSNGVLVPRFAREIHENVDKVQISLDGPDAVTNDAVRGTNMYRHILRAVDLLADQGTPTRIGMTAIPVQWETWRDGFETIRSRYAGYPNVEFKLSYGVMAYGRGDQLDRTEVFDKREVDAFTKVVNGQLGPKITRHQAGCGYAEQIVVGPDGTIYPCHLLDAPVCHIDEYPLAEIVRILAGVSHHVSVDNVEGCRDCEIRYLCGGGCRVLAGLATGSRLLNTCTSELKLNKYRNLAKSYAATAH